MELATIRDMAITPSTTDRQTTTQAVEPCSHGEAGMVSVSTDPNLCSVDCNFTSTQASGNEFQGNCAFSYSSVASIDQSNQQYSIYALTTAAGAIAERYAYTAYGQPTILSAAVAVLTSSAINNRYTYTALVLLHLLVCCFHAEIFRQDFFGATAVHAPRVLHHQRQ